MKLIKLTNASKRQIGVPMPLEFTTVNPGESLVMSRTEMDHLARKAQVAQWLHLGMLTVEPASKQEAPEPTPEEPEGVEIIHHGGGWYTVEVAGIQVTDGKIRKGDAEEVAADYA